MGDDFSRRSPETELMDTDALGPEDYRACLEDVATVNALTLTPGSVLTWLDLATRGQKPGDRVTVLDIGYSYGDLLRRSHAWSRHRGRGVDLVGIDLKPWSETIARAATPADVPIEYMTGNVFGFEPERQIDFVISSQTTHDLSNEELVIFIRWVERVAERGWFIADLHRHIIPFYAFRFLSRLARWRRFVQHDGPISVARSFRRADWEKLLHSAGLDLSAVTIRWHVPFRLRVSRLR
jgi:hypothetical protein